jgi:hypothetical protein
MQLLNAAALTICAISALVAAGLYSMDIEERISTVVMLLTPVPNVEVSWELIQHANLLKL